MVFSNRIYDILKWICLIFLPAISVFYSAIDGVFGWGYAAAVCTVIAALETFIGSLIGISTAAYRKEDDQGGE